VDRLFLSVLHRPPTPTEAEKLTKYLGQKDKPEALFEDAIWALVNSPEFRFNH
jgi:hypothetical protein